MRNLSFLKHAGVYALGDLLMMAGGFILLPLYTRRLTLAEFGTLEGLDRVGEIAAICLIARGIPLAAIAFYRQSATEEQRGRVVGAATLAAGIGALLGAAALMLLAGPLAAWMRIDSALLLWTATVTALLDGLSVVVLATNQARLDSLFYVAVSFAQFLVKVGLCVFLVVGLGWGVWGVVTAALLRSALFAAFLLAREGRHGMAWPDRQTLRDIVGFALPFVPVGLCFFVLNSADRFFLFRCVSLEEVGIYGLGYKLATMVGLFSLTPLYRVWSARMHDVGKEPDAPVVFGQMTTYLLGAYLFLGLGLCLLQDEVIAVLAGANFAPAARLIPLVVLAYGFYGASLLMDAGFYVIRQTRRKFGIALGSTVTMLALYAWLIPLYGSLGAAVATLGGFIVHAGLTCAVAQRVFPVRYEWGRLLGMLLFALGAWFAAQALDSGWTMVPFKLGIWLLWPALLWLTGLVRPAEKRQVLELVRIGVARLGALGRRMPFCGARFQPATELAGWKVAPRHAQLPLNAE